MLQNWFRALITRHAAASNNRRPVRQLRPGFKPRFDELEERALMTAGALDPTFGAGSKVTTDFLGDSRQAQGVMMQPDGKIVVAGSAFTGSTFDFAVTRLNPDGTLDNTFGTNGRVTTDFAGAGDTAAAVVLGGGKIYVGGYAVTGGSQQFALARYNDNGTLDTTFNPGGPLPGTVLTDFNGAADAITGLAYIPLTGKIVAAGYTGTGNNRRFALARYNANGSLDNTFNGGMVTTSFGLAGSAASAVVANPLTGVVVAVGYTKQGNGAYDFAVARYLNNGMLDNSFNNSGQIAPDLGGADLAEAVAVQSDGKLLVGGSSTPVGGSVNFALLRLNTDGSLDQTFDGDGMLTTDFNSGTDQVDRLVIQPDGRIVAGGTATVGGKGRFALARYISDGTLDPTFGGSGKVTTANGNEAYGLTLQSDGKLVAAGRGTAATGVDDFVVARYSTNGTLDAGFGAAGTVHVNFVESNDPTDQMVVQPDGKIVLVGSTYVVGHGYDFALARYHADGSLDTTFGLGGRVATDFTGSNDYGQDVLLQPDGKIVVGGSSLGPVNSTDFALARYNPDGSLDTTFDMDGKVTIDFAGGSDFGYRFALQPNGKIVIVGYTGPGLQPDVALARLNPDGSLDSDFDGDGKLTTNFGGKSGYPAGVALQADGKIVVAGQTEVGNIYYFALARYSGVDGSLDSTFGPNQNGKVTTGFNGGSGWTSAVAVQADGKIVAAGQTDTGGGGTNFALVRYKPNGDLDTGNFSVDGKVITDFNGGSDSISDVLLQQDGSILVGGTTTNGFALARYRPDGALDASFGSNGKVVTDVVSGNTDYLTALALQPDGKIVAAGETDNGTYDFALVRYENDQFQFSNAAFSIAEDGGSATITVTRTGGSSGTVSVTASTGAGTAIAGTDYTPVTNVLTFLPGDTTKTFTIPIIMDTLLEGTETVPLTLSNPQGGVTLGGTKTATLSITNTVVVVQLPPPPPPPTSQEATISGNGAGPSGVETPALVRVSRGRLRRRANGRWRQTVLLHNEGGAVRGPVCLVLDQLNRAVRLRKPVGLHSGKTAQGSPYVDVVTAEGRLGLGETRMLVLEFSNPLGRKVRYRPRVLVGAEVQRG